MLTRGLLLDIEGVLVADKRYGAVPDAVAFIAAARAAQCPIRLITNNTTDARTRIHQMLGDAGFDFTLAEIHTCTHAAALKLRELGTRRCLVCGNQALRDIFTEAGFEVVDDAQVDAVVVGMDEQFDYARLLQVCDALLTHRAALIALHRNRLYTNAAGRRAPSVGPLVAAIEYATQVEAVMIGKPSPAYLGGALGELGVAPGEVLCVSDDCFSDLVGARQLGMRTALVLSGKYTDARIVEKLPLPDRPDYLVPRIGDLLSGGAVRFA